MVSLQDSLFVNKFYVSYPWDHCIKVFDKTGVSLHDIGCKGSSEGQFDLPNGLVIDKCNQLIVCDVLFHRRVQLFTMSGKFLRKLQGEYFNNNKPWYAAFNNNDSLIVAGRFGNCIFVNNIHERCSLAKETDCQLQIKATTNCL